MGGNHMSNKVKERLKKLMIELTHDERMMLDEAIDKIAISMGVILVKDEKPCDAIIDELSDGIFTELVRRIKRKKKAIVPMEA
jgi:nucleotidyltransferase/DNA polymerase involved in DNA repair